MSSENLNPVSAIAIQLALQHEEPGVVLIGEPMEEIDPALANLISHHLHPAVVTARFCPLDEIPYPSLREAVQKCDFYRFRVIAMQGRAMVVNADELRSFINAC